MIARGPCAVFSFFFLLLATRLLYFINFYTYIYYDLLKIDMLICNITNFELY